MQILAVSDVVVDRFHNYGVKKAFPRVEIILGCGDLPYEYLEFLVSVFDVPLLYVPGNHDPQFDPHNPAARADGCENIDQQVTRVKGLTIAGLGGSILYKPSGVNQYSQVQMSCRVAALAPALIWSWVKTMRPVDLFIAHSPPYGIHDDDDQPHVGFKAFINLIKTFQPRYFLHGHTMAVKRNLEKSAENFERTQVININPYQFIDLEPHVR